MRISDTDVAVDHLVWSPNKGQHIAKQAGNDRNHAPNKFLKGPIPWNWIEKAACLSGKALEVALCVWRLSGAMKSKTVKLSTREVLALGVDRHAKSRALKALEVQGLISVVRHRGRFPIVTIVDV